MLLFVNTPAFKMKSVFAANVDQGLQRPANQILPCMHMYYHTTFTQINELQKLQINPIEHMWTRKFLISLGIHTGPIMAFFFSKY